MSNPAAPQYPPQPPQPPQQPPAKKRRKWPWIAAGAVGFLILVAALSGNDDTNTKTNEPHPPTAGAEQSDASPPGPEAPPTPPKPAEPASSITKDGTFLIGADIVPGTYRSDGGSDCYWERDKDLLGNLDSIIANGNGNGQQVVTLLPTDKAFQTQRCGTWTLIPS